MAKSKSAMPSYMGDKRILFPSTENFGKGSYDSYRGLHSGYLEGNKIIKTVVTDDDINDTTVFNQFPLRIYEN